MHTSRIYYYYYYHYYARITKTYIIVKHAYEIISQDFTNVKYLNGMKDYIESVKTTDDPNTK